ncbi:hypothetical protein D3C75_1121790 [compost metagenome]
MHARTVYEIFTAKMVAPPAVLRVLHHTGKLWNLGDQVDYVHAEPVDAFIEPPGHHIVDFLPHLGIVPIQVRLLPGEQVQEIFAGLRIVFPGRAAEEGAPIVRLMPVLARPPDVIVPVRAVRRFA